MAISIPFSRPKLATTVTVSPSLESKTVSESSGSFRLPICLDSIVQDTVTLTGLSYTSGAATVTAASSTMLTNVKLGDEIVMVNGSDFTSGAYVIAKPTSTTLTMSANASATRSATTGTVQAQTLDATVYIAELTNTIAGSNLNVAVKIYTMDGTKVYDSDDTGAYDGAVVGDGTAVSLGSVSINLDTFYTNARIARTNS